MKQFELQLDIMRDMIIIIDRVSRDLEVTRSGPYVVDLRRREKEFEEGNLTYLFQTPEVQRRRLKSCTSHRSQTIKASDRSYAFL